MAILLVLIGAAAGAIIGSFVATVTIRWPQGRSAMGGRSACDGCGVTLVARDLVPLASWILLRGRCRRCGDRIDPRHPAIELAAAVIGASALAVAPGWSGVAGCVFGWTLLLLLVLDAEHFWLPDRLTLPLAAAGLAAAGLGLEPSFESRAIGLVAGWGGLTLVAAGYRLWRGRQGLGGGDPKLFGAIGAWLGWAALPAVLFGAAMTGLVVVALRLIRGRAVTATDRLPFGVLLALAAWPAWLVISYWTP